MPSRSPRRNRARTATATATASADRLTRERILAATLAQIDACGLDGLNLRELAAQLGVYPTAIYWHVPSRNELVAGAVALAMGGVMPDPRARSWQDRLRSVFTRFRQALRRHPNLAPVVGGQLLYSSTQELLLLEHIVLALEDAGFDADGLVDAYNVVVAAMAGFVTLELSVPPAEDSDGWAAGFRQRVSGLDGAQFPALARHIERLADKAFILRWSGGRERPLERGFAAWTDTVIWGLEQRAARPAPPAARRRRPQPKATP